MRTLVAFVLLVPAAHAGSIPLATFSWSQPQPVSLPAEYIAGLQMFSGTTLGVAWYETVSSFPHHSFADAATVEAFYNELYTDDNGQLRFWNGGQVYNNGLCAWCQFYWSIGDGRDQHLAEKAAAGFTAQMLAPSLGPHLIGYTLTGIERTVTANTQTITFHGFAIPEPGCWLLVLCGCLHLVTRAARKRGGGSCRSVNNCN